MAFDDLPHYNFDSIVLSGGGNKGIIELAIVEYHRSQNHIDFNTIKEYAGTSIGAVNSLLLCCGYTPLELFTMIYSEEDFFSGGSAVSPRSTLKLEEEGLGFLSLVPFLRKLEKFVMDKLGIVPNLKELHDMTGKVLHISQTNVSQKKERKLNYLTYPDLNCVLAVGYSCCLPFIFKRLKHNNHYIADGALVNNFPWDYISDACKSTLGVYVWGGNTSTLKEDTFTGYAYMLTMIPVKRLSELRLELAPPSVLVVKCSWPGNFMNATLSQQEKMEMFLFGMHVAKQEHHTTHIFVKEY